MVNNSPKKQPWSQTIKTPLIFSVALGLVAAFVAMISATGGSQNELRFDIGLIAFGIAFIASLLVISVLTMTAKENDPELGTGSGVNRSSDDPEQDPSK